MLCFATVFILRFTLSFIHRKATLTTMCSQDASSHRQDGGDHLEEEKKPPYWKMWLFLGFLGFDAVSSLTFLTPLVPFVRKHEGETLDHYTLYGSFSDLSILAILRLVTAGYALLRSYCSGTMRPESPFDLYHPNGDRKTREELDNEALEEPCCPWFRRYVSRSAFPCEVVCLVSGLLSVAKCLARLNQEIGTLSDSQPHHPIFWFSLALSAICSAIEPVYLDSITNLVAGRGRSQQSMTWMRRIGSNLSIPLLSADSPVEEEQGEEDDIEQGDDQVAPEDVRGVSDITTDSSYKANWSDLLALCVPDLHLIVFAFIFLLLAALAQIYIPKYTGNILDSLTETFSNEDDDKSRTPIWDVPGFVSNVEKLVMASILCGVFSGVRGSIFTVVRLS